jgi:hypothetical protein
MWKIKVNMSMVSIANVEYRVQPVTSSLKIATEVFAETLEGHQQTTRVKPEAHLVN